MIAAANDNEPAGASLRRAIVWATLLCSPIWAAVAALLVAVI